MVLDMMAAMLSLGRATHRIVPDPLLETGLSQVFLAMNPAALGDAPAAAAIAEEIVASLHNCRAAEKGKTVRYPGEQTLRTRAENMKLGLLVDPGLWAQILAL
jgi:3-dehydro-L-gulonate 2-dehydrogenase